MCFFSCLFCTPERQARDDDRLNRDIIVKTMDSSEPETLYRQVKENKTMKCASSSTRKKNVNGSIFTNGITFFYNSVPTTGGNRSFLTRTTANSGIKISASQAKLSNLSVSPSSGNTDTIFTFRVIFSDTSNKSPLHLDLVINNSCYSMSEEASQRKDYVKGCFYTRSLNLDKGNTIFYVNGLDFYGNEICSSSGIVVVYANSQNVFEDDDYTAIGIILFGIILFISVLAMIAKKSKIFATNHSASHAVNRPTNINHVSNSNSLANHSHTTNPGFMRISSNYSSLADQRISGNLIQARSSGTQRLVINPRIPQSAFIQPPSQSNSPAPTDTNQCAATRRKPSILAVLGEWHDQFTALLEQSRPDKMLGVEVHALDSSELRNEEQYPNYITPRMDSSILTSIETWNEKDLAILEQSREKNTPEMETRIINSLESWDEKFSVIQDQSCKYITPLTDPSIPASLETWNEKDLAMLEQSREKNMPEMEAGAVDSREPTDDERELPTPVHANILSANDAAQDAYTLIPNEDDCIARKIRLTYVDPAIINKILPTIEHLETQSNEKISLTEVTSGNDGRVCTLLLCHVKGELGNLFPLRRLLAIEALF